MPAANPEEGEVALTVGDRTYIYLADMRALCIAEKAMSRDEERLVISQEIVLSAIMGSNRHAHYLLWAALQRHHPDVTLDDAMAILAKIGGSTTLVQLLQDLRKSMEPDAEDAPKRPRAARQKKTDGTGVPATSSPDASVSTATSSGD